jgi:hypothetical protein
MATGHASGIGRCWPRMEVCSPQAPRLARRARRCLSGLGPGLACGASTLSLLLNRPPVLRAGHRLELVVP